LEPDAPVARALQCRVEAGLHVPTGDSDRM
jgi:hypothetical protein